ncbi:hypothetical protein, partial [Streptomyces boluensis]
MSVDRSSPVSRSEPLTVVVAVEGTAPALELLGTLDAGQVDSVVRQVLGTRWGYRLRSQEPGRHTLTFTVSGPGTGTGSELPVGELADRLTSRLDEDSVTRGEDEGTYGPVVKVLRASPLQRELLAAAEVRAGAGIGV